MYEFSIYYLLFFNTKLYDHEREEWYTWFISHFKNTQYDVCIISVPVFVILCIIIDAQDKTNLTKKQQAHAKDVYLEHE